MELGQELCNSRCPMSRVCKIITDTHLIFLLGGDVWVASENRRVGKRWMWQNAPELPREVGTANFWRSFWMWSDGGRDTIRRQM
eukprot:2000017-Amphidinium_carterae.2